MISGEKQPSNNNTYSARYNGRLYLVSPVFSSVNSQFLIISIFKCMVNCILYMTIMNLPCNVINTSHCCGLGNIELSSYIELSELSPKQKVTVRLNIKVDMAWYTVNELKPYFWYINGNRDNTIWTEHQLPVECKCVCPPQWSQILKFAFLYLHNARAYVIDRTYLGGCAFTCSNMSMLPCGWELIGSGYACQ